MRVAMMTREYPPEVYGGAGVHVTELVAQLRKLCEVDVHCMGAPRAGAFTYQPDSQLRGANPALSTLSSDLVMANAAAEASVVHTHTWYTGLAGQLAVIALRRPARVDRALAGAVAAVEGRAARRRLPDLVVGGAERGDRRGRRHRRQLGHARRRVAGLSDAGSRPGACRAQRDRHRGVAPGRAVAVRPGESVLAELGVDRGRPMVAFVGRITRQKGVAHLLAAAHQFSPDVQLVLCAGAPDTPEIAAEVAAGVAELARARTGVFWVREMLPDRGDTRDTLGCNSFRMPISV